MTIKSKLTLTINPIILRDYKKFAEENGLRISARVEKFLIKDMKTSNLRGL